MIEVEVTDNAKAKARKYQVKKKLDKQVEKLETDSKNASLWLRPLQEQKNSGIWKFRLDKHFWGLVIKTGTNKLKVYDVIKHL